MQCHSKPPSWQAYRSFLHRRTIPAAVLDYLLDSASLTARLQRLCRGRFRVHVLREHYTWASLDDARTIGIAPGTRLRVREVQLQCEGVSLVYAKSLIPVTSLRGRLRRIHFQGNRSLGAALFADPTVQRGPIEIRVADGSLIAGGGSGVVWARRSLFRVSDCPLLVAEYYLPVLFDAPVSIPNKEAV